jgi:hypothetical protein
MTIVALPYMSVIFAELAWQPCRHIRMRKCGMLPQYACLPQQTFTDAWWVCRLWTGRGGTL